MRREGGAVGPDNFREKTMIDRRDLCAALAATAVAGPALALAGPTRRDRCFAFTYFANADNGGAGMRLAISDGGFTYRPVRGGAPVVVPQVEQLYRQVLGGGHEAAQARSSGAEQRDSQPNL